MIAFEDWKKNNPDEKLDDIDFYMVGEVYGYSIHNGKNYSYDGDTSVNFYAQGLKSLINFSLKYEVREKTAKQIFSQYSASLNTGELKDYSVMNYLASHDDGSPFDAARTNVFETANFLMLTPGAVQIYYGDETARMLNAKAKGDAKLRSFMNWEELASNAKRQGYSIKEILAHYQKLGQFRKSHPSVGAGVHELVNERPYVFKRTYENGAYTDEVLISMEPNLKEIMVEGVFANGENVKNFYSGEIMKVARGKVVLNMPSKLVLLEKI